MLPVMYKSIHLPCISPFAVIHYDVSLVKTTRLALRRKEPTMLVLSRQRDESIMIGDKVVITIVDIRGDKVRLGIEAPSEIPVHRQEVYEAIKREGRLGGAGRAEKSNTKDKSGT
jgi:carbon storage regulator